MKTKNLLFMTAGLFMYPFNQKAQVSTYTFTQSQSVYGAANTGALVGPAMQDDDVTTVTLPFAFIYDGVSYNNIDVCSNGYLGFSALSGNEYAPISDVTTQFVISPFGNDLMMGNLIEADMTVGSNSLTNCSSTSGFSVGDVIFDWNGDFAANPVITAIAGNIIVLNLNALNTNSTWPIINEKGYIKQSVSGTAPNRVCEFEFSNFCRFFVPEEILNFKVRLYETSNNIEFLYGTVIPGNDNTPCEVGLKGVFTDFKSRKAVAPVTWSNSVASVIITDYCEFEPGVFPLSGQSYLWGPLSCTVPVVTVASSNTLICKGLSATLTASGATTYSWSGGPSTAQQTVNPTTTTSYTVVGANETCTTSYVFTQNVSDCTGLTEQTARYSASELSAYPNPFSSALNLKNNSEKEVTVTVTDALGKRIYASKINAGATNILPTESLSRGFYFISVSSGSESYTKKLIRE